MHVVHLTRDSVAAGDDIHAPHTRIVKLPDCAMPFELVEQVLKQGYLPKIEGGRASWVAASRGPLAVCAQEWSSPRPLTKPTSFETLANESGAIRLHFSYLAQVDANLVFDVLNGCTFDATTVR